VVVVVVVVVMEKGVPIGGGRGEGRKENNHQDNKGIS